MKPTNEQQEIFDTFYTLYNANGKRLVVDAGAGTGKTSTALKLAETFPSINFNMLCFNKLNAEELNARSKAIPNIKASTIHKLARDWALSQKDSSLLKIDLDVTWLTNRFTKGRVAAKQEIACAWKLKKALTAYFQQKEENFAVFYNTTSAPEYDIAQMAQEYLRGVWPTDGVDMKKYPISLEGILKMMQLHKAQLFSEEEVIIIEEYQDVNGIQAALLEQQDCFLFAIGDVNQAIYSWRGGGALLSSVQEWPQLRLTKSFRVNPTDAKLANYILKELGDFTLEGLSDKKEIQHKAKLFRTNKELIVESIACMGKKIPHNLAIDLPALWDNLWHIFNLKNGKPVDKSRASIKYLKTIQDYNEALEHSDEVASLDALYDFTRTKGGLYKLQKDLTAFLESYGSDALTLSTVNKAKGLEWDEVTLHNDILTMLLKKQAEVHAAVTPYDITMSLQAYREELRLLYVAVTRAKVRTLMPQELLSMIHTFGCKTGEER